MRRRFGFIAILLLVIGIVAGCGESEEPTAIPQIQGKLIPWGTDSPAGGRYIVLCKLLGPAQDGECVLTETAAETDSTGAFSLSGATEGSYFVLYDSGLSDFQEALEKWGGETLDFSDMDWLSEFLGVDLRTEPVEFRVPEGISHSPHEGWLTQYCTLTLSFGNSPFIIAHDMEKAQEDRELQCLVVDVTPGELEAIKVQAAYFGEQ
ncbi:MAG: hypothetical protein WA996_14905 [Candidatus Promineifilaceae bacterium]